MERGRGGTEVYPVSIFYGKNTDYMHRERMHIFLFISAQLFNDSCDEMISWMKEKDNLLLGNVDDLDLENVRKLQRKHQVIPNEHIMLITFNKFSQMIIVHNLKECNFHRISRGN